MKSAQPFLRTSQSEIFAACFCEYGQYWTNTCIATYTFTIVIHLHMLWRTFSWISTPCIESLSYCYSTVPQDPSFHHKVFKFAVAFSSNSFYFLHSPLYGLACCTLGYQLMLVSFISQSVLNRFQCNLYFCLPYACSASAAIFRLIWSLKVTPECTLHSRVKDSRTQNSIIIFSSILRKY